MNIRYKLLWIDDSKDYIEATEELVEGVIISNNMFPQVVTFNTFDEFKKRELDNFDLNRFNIYDLIVIDYALSDETGETGDNIIREIRNRNIYTDVVFYSSAYEKMMAAIKNKGQLSGVYFADKLDLTTTIDAVIKKNIRREFSLANIRGILMDGTSEFDFMSKNVSLELYAKLTPEEQKEIIEKANSFMMAAKKQGKSNFLKLEKLYDRGDYQKFFEELMNSVYYVIQNEKRYEIMWLLVKASGLEDLFEEDFVSKYASELIKPRNDLAHKKLIIGECGQKIHVLKQNSVSDKCQKNCAECNSVYDIHKCEEIRQHIFNYFKLFKELSDKII